MQLAKIASTRKTGRPATKRKPLSRTLLSQLKSARTRVEKLLKTRRMTLTSAPRKEFSALKTLQEHRNAKSSVRSAQNLVPWEPLLISTVSRRTATTRKPLKHAKRRRLQFQMALLLMPMLAKVAFPLVLLLLELM